MKKLPIFTMVLALMIALNSYVFAKPATSNTFLSAGLDAKTLSDIGFYLKHVTPLGNPVYDIPAAKCLKAAAALGYGPAMVQLGEMYAGNWVPLEKDENNIQLAIKWWNAGWKAGAPDGYYNLGLMYANAPIPGGNVPAGHNFVKQDNEKALKYFKAAFEKKDVKSGRYIGIFYEKGIGVKQDSAMTAKYFELAAENGDSTSQFYFANYLLEGKGIAQDVKKAMAIYQKVVDKKGHDIGNCANALGQIYEKGKHVETDPIMAKDYYLIAADNGNKDAKQSLANYAAILYKDGYDQLKAGQYETAIPLLIQSANLGNPDAMKLTGTGKK